MSGDLDDLNHIRYVSGQRAGHYESFYQRANHPTEPLAFWIRYTIFSPAGRPADAIGELWAVLFDGVTGRHVVAKEEHPLSTCVLDRNSFGARIGAGLLEPGALTGTATGPADTLTWNLRYSGDQAPLYLLPDNSYRRGFPKAKSLVGSPGALFRGQLTANGREIDVQDWIGSQNHNWGSQHTDHYAFGQVAGFDDHPDSFLEVLTAKARIGPVKTPFVTFLVLRHEGREHRFVSLPQALRASGRFRYFEWTFTSEDGHMRISGRISAPPAAFVGLNYYNPPGGSKHCLNTKIGSCELDVTDKRTASHRVLSTTDRALFEILTDDRTHGVPIRA
jgi:hypothetical protein